MSGRTEWLARACNDSCVRLVGRGSNARSAAMFMRSIHDLWAALGDLRLLVFSDQQETVIQWIS